MSLTLPITSSTWRSHTSVALLTVAVALSASSHRAGAAITAADPSAVGAAHSTGTTLRARVKSRVRTHAKLSARLHAKARTRLRTRHHAHLPALATVASSDAAVVELGGASLRGSRAAVDRAYDEAVREGLPFVRSNEELERLAGAGEYVALSRSTATYRLKGVGSPYVRPATRDFVTSFAADYSRECGEPLTVTSAMRPTSVRLRNSVQKSVHPTGMAVDLRASRTGCRDWMRTTLLGLERQGAIDATEEHHPAHFHVVVLRTP